jgi:hypothetical protein
VLTALRFSSPCPSTLLSAELTAFCKFSRKWKLQVLRQLDPTLEQARGVGSRDIQLDHTYLTYLTLH